MAEKEYVCAYKYCSHRDKKVKQSEAVKLGKRYYHWDCAVIKQEIKNCVDTYMDYIDDKTKYATVNRIFNNLVFKDKIPTDFILKNIKNSKKYYCDRPVIALYGIRKLFYREIINNYKGGD